MPVIASRLIEYARKEQERRETVPIICDRTGRLHAKIHKFDGYLVRYRGDKGKLDRWYQVTHEQYLYKRFDADRYRTSPLSVSGANGGRIEQVARAGDQGLYAYCRHCREFHLVAHQKYMDAHARLEMLAIEEKLRRDEVTTHLQYVIKSLFEPVRQTAQHTFKNMFGLCAHSVVESFQFSKFNLFGKDSI
jgi:hypothetical protein